MFLFMIISNFINVIPLNIVFMFYEFYYFVDFNCQKD